jgi:hypothetical protein
MVGPVMRATIRKIGRAPRRAFANRDSLAETYYHHRRDGGRDQSQRVCAIRKKWTFSNPDRALGIVGS